MSCNGSVVFIVTITALFICSSAIHNLCSHSNLENTASSIAINLFWCFAVSHFMRRYPRDAVAEFQKTFFFPRIPFKLFYFFLYVKLVCHMVNVYERLNNISEIPLRCFFSL